MPELSTAPLAGPFGPGDYFPIIQGGVWKKAPPQKILQGSIGSTPLIIDMTANGLLGAFVLNIKPASACSIIVETSRDGGTTYQQIGASPWAVEQSFNYDYGPNDTNYVTHVRLTRATGSLLTSRFTCTAGIVALNGTQQDFLGIVTSKALVVDATTRIGYPDPVNDRGWLLQSFGTFQNTLVIMQDAIKPWDRTRGDVFFCVERASVATVFVNAPTSKGTVANQAAMVALTAIVGDYCTRSDVGHTFVLTALPASTAANWTDIGAASGAVTISNPGALEFLQDGPMLMFKSRAPNIWTVS